MAKKLTLVIDLDRCIGCCGCEVACKQENDVALDVNWNKVSSVGPYGTFPNVEQYFLPSACQQCDKPPCVEVCPTKASYKRQDGIVLVERKKCVGCRQCVKACPYGVRAFNKDAKVAEKCTLCVQLLAVSKEPACVKNCAVKARFFGDINDPGGELSNVLQKADKESIHSLRDLGNQPSVKYILHRKTAAWRS